jgi:hypothetical protein
MSGASNLHGWCPLSTAAGGVARQIKDYVERQGMDEERNQKSIWHRRIRCLRIKKLGDFISVCVPASSCLEQADSTTLRILLP